MLAIACDHGGFELKERIKKQLDEGNLPYTDFGCYDLQSCDYPDFAKPAAEAVSSGLCDRGILICTTGIGMSMAANKVEGVRCALCADPWSAEMTRRHNDANILALGAGVVGEGLAQRIVSVFLNTAFEGGRHQRRVDKITALEEKKTD